MVTVIQAAILGVIGGACLFAFFGWIIWLITEHDELQKYRAQFGDLRHKPR